MIVSQQHAEPLNKIQANQNFLGQDGLIYNNYVGDQNGQTLKKMVQELTKLAAKQRLKNKSVRLLTDMSIVGEINLAARRGVLEISQNLDYDRCAVFGCNIFIFSIVKLLITASGRGFKIRVFDNRIQAKKWLLSK